MYKSKSAVFLSIIFSFMLVSSAYADDCFNQQQIQHRNCQSQPTPNEYGNCLREADDQAAQCYRRHNGENTKAACANLPPLVRTRDNHPECFP
jgi:hypothetical protein